MVYIHNYARPIYILKYTYSTGMVHNGEILAVPVVPATMHVGAEMQDHRLVRLDSLTCLEFYAEIHLDTLRCRGRFSESLFSGGSVDVPRCEWVEPGRLLEVSSRDRHVVINVYIP